MSEYVGLWNVAFVQSTRESHNLLVEVFWRIELRRLWIQRAQEIRSWQSQAQKMMAKYVYLLMRWKVQRRTKISNLYLSVSGKKAWKEREANARARKFSIGKCLRRILREGSLVAGIGQLVPTRGVETQVVVCWEPLPKSKVNSKQRKACDHHSCLQSSLDLVVQNGELSLACKWKVTKCWELKGSESNRLNDPAQAQACLLENLDASLPQYWTWK